MNLEIEPLSEPLGAIVYGWDPTCSLSPDDESSIRAGLQDHQVLVFRGQPQPSDDELVDFARQFGDLVQGSAWFGDIDPKPEILRVNNLVGDDGVPQGTGGSMSLEWHSDYSYVPTVGKESFLEAVELPEINPPQTCFCSQYAAFERLSEAMKNAVRGLRAFHSITGYGAGPDRLKISNSPQAGEESRDDFQAKRNRNRQLGVEQPKIPEAEHPVVLRHPDSGREILYVSRGITRSIVGIPKDESDDLLKELTTGSTRPEHVYAHTWRVGDLVMFDTLGTLHRRDVWDPDERRVMRQLSTLWTPPSAEHAA
jgi:taurine dioxygenase/pentalenolactone F synthase